MVNWGKKEREQEIKKEKMKSNQESFTPKSQSFDNRTMLKMSQTKPNSELCVFRGKSVAGRRS